MEIPFLKSSASKYIIETEIFEGPLDLLLQLIEKEELDITQLSLAKVTDEYLAHLSLIANRDPLEVSSFLVIAAQLVLIKSRILLPIESMETSKLEIEGSERLIQQLREYKKFKNAAAWLLERENNHLRTYFRSAPPPKLPEILDFTDLSIDELARLYHDLLIVREQPYPLEEIISITTLTLKNRINAIMEQFKSISHTKFSSLVDRSTKLDIIVTFLALLELIKNNLVEANQANIFGEIELQSLGEMNHEIETEF